MLLTGVGRRVRVSFLSLISCSIGLAKVFSFSLNRRSFLQINCIFLLQISCSCTKILYGDGWDIVQKSKCLLNIFVGEIPPMHKMISDVYDAKDNLSCVATPEFCCNPGAVLLLLTCGCHLALNLR